LLEGAGIDQLLAQAGVFFFAAVAPVDAVGLAQGGHVGHPGDARLAFFTNAGALRFRPCITGEFIEKLLSLKT
jgi:hypothetical protein